ncbi:glycosyltransferase family 8 protein [Helicobacter cetorum]|uniref:Lipopolysaccharide1, 2-glycosyltransferase n=1 Tax=Helicobacter cetorum (strain ATCC BAA-540 / CCUG 52418 / MIT 99-5656) TaxID=1163745 RepID=I0ERS2_HELCM|nr:glycosyltransferase family 8 protein [Helicobacter cetorum]AFI05641.1 lipopolysaccharide1, 2-glycosyltransferase [Helicobacter cetorum MIT 99-5656]
MSVVIPIVVAFDDNYCIPAGVSLYSMLEHAKKERDNQKLFYKIHCLVDHLSVENTEKLQQTIACFSHFSSIEFLDISAHQSSCVASIEPSVTDKINQAFSQLNIYAKTRFSKMVVCRLFLASLFSPYEKILMFDVDTLFLNDISESFFIPIEEYYFGATKDFSSPKSLKHFHNIREKTPRATFSLYEHYLAKEDLQIILEHNYNVGFLIVNLKLWRVDNLEKRLMDLVYQKGQSVFCPEQDILTLASYKKVLVLPYIYNTHPYMIHNQSFIPNQQEIVMLHFYFDRKPWILPTSPCSKEWHDTLLNTPFCAEYSMRFLKQVTEALSLKNKQQSFEFLLPILNVKTLIEYIFFGFNKLLARLKNKLTKTYN